MKKLRSFPTKIAYSTFSLGILFTGLAFFVAKQRQSDHEAARLESLSQETTETFFQSLNIITYGLAATRGIYGASKTVEHAELRKFVDSLDIKRNFPSVWGFGFIEYVPKAKLKQFLRETRSDDQPNFSIKNKSAFPSSFIIKHIFPYNVNQSAAGLDISFEDHRREAALMATDTGKPTLTRRIDLVQDSHKETGFLFLSPIYEKKAPLRTVAERRKAIRGWVYAPLTLQKIVTPILNKYGRSIFLDVYDEDGKILFGHRAKEDDRTIVSKFRIGSRQWTIKITPKATFYTSEPARFLPYAILPLGILLTLVTSVIIHRLINSKDTAFVSKIKEGEAFIKDILRSANSAIIVTNQQGIIQSFNRRASEMLGYQAEELVSKANFNLFYQPHSLKQEDPADQTNSPLPNDHSDPTLSKLASLGAEERKECSFIPKNRSRLLPVEISVSFMRKPDGEITGFIIIADDITKRNEQEQELKKNEALFKAYFEHSPHGFAFLSLDETWINVNNAMCEMLGYKPEDLIGKRCIDITYQDDKINPDEESLVKRLIEREIDTFDIEKRYIHANGNPVWVTRSVALIRDENDKPRFFINHIQDMQLRKDQENAISLHSYNLSLFKAALDMHAVVSITTPEGDLTYVNDKFCEWSRYSRHELIGTSQTRVILPPKDEEDFDSINEQLSAGKCWHGQIRVKAKDGTIHWSATTMVPFMNEERKLSQIISIRTDISEQKAIEFKQERLVAELDRSNRELANFAYLVSHDLKAPLRGLNSVATWLDQDYGDQLGEEGRNHIRLLKSRVKRMHGFIDGLLQFSRVGREQTALSRICLHSEISAIIEAISAPKGIKFYIDTELPDIYFEAIRIRQVFQNFISNAVKYMQDERGEVHIGCISPSIGEIRCYIRDTGPGIEEKYFDKIFKLFQTLHAKDDYESTGVGLALIKKIIEGKGGRVWVESKIGVGSTFWFTLPTTLLVTKGDKKKQNITQHSSLA